MDITEFREKDSSILGSNLVVPINEENQYEFAIPTYEITDQKNYTYESCYLYNCPIYEKTLIAANQKTLLFLKVNSDTTISDYLSFLKKYGKVRYKVGEQEYLEKINLKITKYRGNYVYLEVPNTIKNAERIELVFTVRTYQYYYLLKG